MYVSMERLPVVAETKQTQKTLSPQMIAMPPKRERGAGETSSEPPLRMIKVGEEDVDLAEDKFRLGEEQYRHHSHFSNDQHTFEYEDERASSPGIRTDTVSLLMKIDQLQAQLKYERRCRLLVERELRELKEMNTLMLQMRHTAHELRVTLGNVLQGEEEDQSVTPPSSQDDVSSYMAEHDTEIRAIHHITGEDQAFIYLAENLRVPKSLYDRIAEISDYKKYTSALLMLLFDRETLATHSLQGRRTASNGDEGHKPQLPPEILTSIIEHIAGKFGVDDSQIKTTIRTKLNNEDKLLKKRLGLSKPENKLMMDQNSLQMDSLPPDNVI